MTGLPPNVADNSPLTSDNITTKNSPAVLPVSDTFMRGTGVASPAGALTSEGVVIVGAPFTSNSHYGM